MEELIQPTLDGLGIKKRPSRAKTHTAASHNPIAQVVLDIQATHLGQTFDYLVDEKLDEQAQPGCLVRVRFGGQRVSGIIWQRTDHSDTDARAIRYIERVLSPSIVSEQMRRDITAVADAYGGTRANIIRVAVPPRVAHVEQDTLLAPQYSIQQRCQQILNMIQHPVWEAYEHGEALQQACRSESFRSIIVDAAPGVNMVERTVATALIEALAEGHSAVAVCPTMRDVWNLMHMLNSFGLQAFAPHDDGATYHGDIAVLSGALSPAERYRAYLAVERRVVRCVIGTRAAMYAPVDDTALFAVVDDTVYQYMDGFMPYANVRGVCRMRAHVHSGTFLAIAQARSVISQWERTAQTNLHPAVSGPSTAFRPLQSTVQQLAPPIRWLNRDELNRLADPSIGARVPHTAVRILSKALESGPVLLSIPSDGITESLSCAQCLQQGRCLRCTGPLEKLANGTVRCRWCAAAATNWHCVHCGGERMRVIRVGAAGTVQELHGLFREMPMIVSTKERGIVEQVRNAPVIVIATPGCEPRVRSGAYRAVAILDAWTSLYDQRMDAHIDVLTAWMHTMSLCDSRANGGQALLCGETDPLIARSLMTWNSSLLAEHELAERVEAVLPPSVSAACVWGRRDAVRQALHNIGVLDGSLAVVHSAHGDLPAVLGPVPIPKPRTVDARELESMGDRVRAVVRVNHEYREQLVLRLRNEVARHVASRESGELRFRLDPKDLL